MNFAEFLSTSCLQNTSGWLLLTFHWMELIAVILNSLKIFSSKKTYTHFRFHYFKTFYKKLKIKRSQFGRIAHFPKPIKCQCCPHIETSQLICTANQLTGFYMRATLALNGLNLVAPAIINIIWILASLFHYWPLDDERSISKFFKHCWAFALLSHF